LIRAILQLLRATSGEVIWLGRQLQQLRPRELRPLRRDLQIIFQDPLGSLDPRMTVLEIIAEPLRLHRAHLGRPEREAAVLAMLARVGLRPDYARRYPHELSGGQCQRVGIARAMILKPKLLVCDEPVSSLDVATQAQVVELLEELRRESATSLLIVSHNLAMVRRLCDRVLVLYLGRALELAATAELFEAPLHPYTRALLEAIPVADPELQPARLGGALPGELPSAVSPPSGCVFHTRCAHAVMLCAHTIPGLQAGGEGRLIACHRWRELRDAHGATPGRTGYPPSHEQRPDDTSQ
jgi:oligopeptide transport system ATP-binding protein